VVRVAGRGDGDWTDGDETAGSLTSNYYLFTGRRYDPESDAYYFRNRYYSGSLGRFVTRDPIGYEAGLNWYAMYHVTGWVDPKGLKGYGPRKCHRLIKEAYRKNEKIKKLDEWMKAHKPRCNVKEKCPCCGVKGKSFWGPGYPKSGRPCVIWICRNQLEKDSDVETILYHELVHCAQACMGIIPPEKQPCTMCLCNEFGSYYHSGWCKKWAKPGETEEDCIKRAAGESCGLGVPGGKCKTQQEVDQDFKEFYWICITNPPWVIHPQPPLPGLSFP